MWTDDCRVISLFAYKPGVFVCVRFFFFFFLIKISEAYYHIKTEVFKSCWS